MLTPADEAVVERDPTLPALGTILDPEALLAAITAVLPDGGLRAVEPVYVRYKPGTSCIVGLRLQTVHGMLDAYVKAHARGEVAKAAKAAERSAVPSPLGPGVAVLDPPTVVLRLFPNDRRLRGAAAVRGERLAYKPERRYVARTARRDGQTSLTKCYAPGDHEAARAVAGHASSAGPLLIPEVTGGSVRRRTIVFEWVHGAPLSLADGGALAGAGAALRLLHRQAPPVHGLAVDQGRALDQAVEAITAVHPDLGPAAASLRRRLGGDPVPPTARATVHGDLAADQVVVCGDRTAVIDLDSLRAGAPEEDLGSFRATAWRDALLAGGSSDEGERAFRALRDGYGPGIDDRLLDACTSAWLLRLGAEPFRRRQPAWQDRIAAVLDAATALA